jgi:hypothetical protein
MFCTAIHGDRVDKSKISSPEGDIWRLEVLPKLSTEFNLVLRITFGGEHRLKPGQSEPSPVRALRARLIASLSQGERQSRFIAKTGLQIQPQQICKRLAHRESQTAVFATCAGFVLAPKALKEVGQSSALRACFENISGGLAAGRGGWLRCSSVADFSRICALVAPRHPPRRAHNPNSELFSKHALKSKTVLLTASSCKSSRQRISTCPATGCIQEHWIADWLRWNERLCGRCQSPNSLEHQN